MANASPEKAARRKGTRPPRGAAPPPPWPMPGDAVEPARRDRQILVLQGFEVEALIGVYSEERHRPQTLTIDMEIEIPDKGSGRSDELADTVDYGAVVADIRREAGQSRFFLLEALAEHICRLVFDRFEAKSIRIGLTKPGILEGVRSAGIRVERHARDR